MRYFTNTNYYYLMCLLYHVEYCPTGSMLSQYLCSLSNVHTCLEDKQPFFLSLTYCQVAHQHQIQWLNWRHFKKQLISLVVLQVNLKPAIYVHDILQTVITFPAKPRSCHLVTTQYWKAYCMTSATVFSSF